MTNRGDGYPSHCPACNADLDGGPIPKDQWMYFMPPYRWSRVIGRYDSERDRTVAWHCPDCGHEWPR